MVIKSWILFFSLKEKISLVCFHVFESNHLLDDDAERKPLFNTFRAFCVEMTGSIPAPCADLLAEEGGRNKLERGKMVVVKPQRIQWVCSSHHFVNGRVQMQRFSPRHGLSYRHGEASGFRPTSIASWCNIVYKAKKSQEGWRSGSSAGSHAGPSPQFGSNSSV